MNNIFKFFKHQIECERIENAFLMELSETEYQADQSLIFNYSYHL